MNKKRVLFLAFAVITFAFIFGLSGVTAQHDGYGSGYGSSYSHGYGSSYGYGYNYGGTYSYNLIKSSPYYNYQKTVYRDPWSYSSTVRRVNYGYNYYPRYNYGYGSYGHGYSYRNNLGRYMNYGYYPPQYVSRTVHRSYY